MNLSIRINMKWMFYILFMFSLPLFAQQSDISIDKLQPAPLAGSFRNSL